MKRRTFLIATALMGLARGSHAAETPTLVPLLKGLENPWGVAFLPDGSALITERPGRLRHIKLSQPNLTDAIVGTPEVAAIGQGGLLGVAIDPDFTGNRLIYMSFTEAVADGHVTAVYRARLSEDMRNLQEGRVIFRQNTAGSGGRHFGSRLVFGRDGHLFVTTGDRGHLSGEAQNPASHIGKVIRITREGEAAPGNPNLPGWAPEVWSTGHRNMQGAALHPLTGDLWTVEHGARGGDEVNITRSGRNYGWPVITHGIDYSGAKIGIGKEQEGMEQPLHFWDPSIAPSGMAFITGDTYGTWKNSLLVGALAGQHVARLTLDGERVVAEEKLFHGTARIRDVAQGPDGLIYLLTDEDKPDGTLYVVAPPGEFTAAQ